MHDDAPADDAERPIEREQAVRERKFRDAVAVALDVAEVADVSRRATVGGCTVGRLERVEVRAGGVAAFREVAELAN